MNAPKNSAQHFDLGTLRLRNIDLGTLTATKRRNIFQAVPLTEVDALLAPKHRYLRVEIHSLLAQVLVTNDSKHPIHVGQLSYAFEILSFLTNSNYWSIHIQPRGATSVTCLFKIWWQRARFK